MSALHAAVLEAFRGMGWQYHVVPDMEVVECAFEAHHTKVLLHAQSHAEAGIVTVVANSSLTVPRSHALKACELIMRTNKELNIGNFELEWDSGQVMYRVSNIFGSHRHDTRIIASLVHTSVAEMDRFTPFLSELVRTSELELPLFSIQHLMAREELLPAPPEPVAGPGGGS